MRLLAVRLVLSWEIAVLALLQSLGQPFMHCFCKGHWITGHLMVLRVMIIESKSGSVLSSGRQNSVLQIIAFREGWLN